jgi:hypothetical protein
VVAGAQRVTGLAVFEGFTAKAIPAERTGCKILVVFVSATTDHQHVKCSAVFEQSTIPLPQRLGNAAYL